MQPLRIDGESLTIESVHDVAFERRPVEIDPSALEKCRRSRAVVDAIVDEGRVVYGVSTGFGKLSDVQIAREDLLALQKNLLRSHAAGVGDPLSEPETRALMLMRANVLA